VLCFVLGGGGYYALHFPASLSASHPVSPCCTKLLEIIDEGIEKTSRTGAKFGMLLIMRRKLLVMLAAVLTLAVGILLVVAGTLTLSILRENTWCVLPVIVILGQGVGLAMLFFFTPSTSSKKTRQKQSAKVVAAAPHLLRGVRFRSTPVAVAPGGTIAPAKNEDVGCCSTALLEKKGHATIRSANFYRTTFVAILSFMIPAVICLPLFVTGKTSFGKAEVRTLPRANNCSLNSGPLLTKVKP
jgi:hypothetical protein